MLESLTIQGSPPQQRRRRGARPGRGRGNGGGKGRPPTFSVMDIIRRLRLGENFHDIAREFGVTVSSVTEVFRKATGPQLAALFAGLTRDAGAADTLRENPIAPVTLSSPVDVMGVMIRALERTQGVERFLDDPRFWDADTHDDRYRMEQSLKVVTAQINWAEKFVDTRLKVLQLVNIDTWLQELLSMVEAVDLELGRELEALGIPLHRVSLGLKGAACSNAFA